MRSWQVSKLNSSEGQGASSNEILLRQSKRYIKFLSLSFLSELYNFSTCVLCYTLRTQASDFLHPSSEKQRSRLLIFPERFSPDKPTTNWPRLIMTGNRFFRGGRARVWKPAMAGNWDHVRPRLWKLDHSPTVDFPPATMYSPELCYFVGRCVPRGNLGYLGGNTTPGLIVAIPWLGSF